MTQSQALEILKTGANVFLTGEPGAGKTYLINQYIEYLRSCGIDPAVTASTGIAATHIGGMTIHSWSGIGILEHLDKYNLDRISSTEKIVKRVTRTAVLIIDEVSMLSASTLSMVEAICREIKDQSRPFGGLQVILIGDFFQLPPIVKYNGQATGQFAYNSQAWIESQPLVCYLTEQYRQEDGDFLNLLKAIRSNTFSQHHMGHIENRKFNRENVPDLIPRFFTHNNEVDLVNNQMLDKLEGKPHEFRMSSKGRASLVESLKKGCLSPEILLLKIGTVVMFTKNNSKAGYVNGTLGVVEKFDKETGRPIVRIRDGSAVEVDCVDWNLEENHRVLALIRQLPLRLAWAITVHKSQGMSMDAAAMDLSKVFEYGQGYVALSRVRKLSGLFLFGWNEQAFLVHPEILVQDQTFQTSSETAEQALIKLSAEELKKIQSKFIASCGGQPNTPIRTKNISVDTYADTLALWNDGKSIAEIALARNLKEETILIHIEKLALADKISQNDLSRLVTIELKPALSEIHNAFRALSPETLSPVFSKFRGRYSYAQLRIARMVYQNEAI
ncbi:MAG: AAA family ATPase [Candidatus Doudnabacteria bacterium]|nr:AAA family ATPase [Candidatus Doudnabacteria bacterium]